MRTLGKAEIPPPPSEFVFVFFTPAKRLKMSE